ncbi:hypothetical protein HYPSUDRAFT_209324 [Hypholoma sublateritium FD-334 SS-4]|uniref:Uncharacterized protein n=1 Tax=Hypholoma sublateritium (strain FD-334 SS-4) TaxID=945553 RepID=A0A0D2NZ73_HYPSF|nr:hypothetical protein HYPSUDRAFT_209324 [Hypholoma sublateritium FD-334 SS-4]
MAGVVPRRPRKILLIWHALYLFSLFVCPLLLDKLAMALLTLCLFPIPQVLCQTLLLKPKSRLLSHLLLQVTALHSSSQFRLLLLRITLEDDRNVRFELSLKQNASKINAVFRILFFLLHILTVTLSLSWSHSKIISPWPMINIQTISGLADLLGVSDLSGLDLYATKSNCWIPTVDFVMSIKTDERIFIRKHGLLPGTSRFLDSMPVSLSDVFSTPPRRKWPYESSPTTCSPTPKTRRFASPSACSPPSPTPRVHVTSLEENEESAMMSATHLDDELNDQDWALGFVLTPTSTLPWPAGMFVRDMAKGFDLIAASRQKLLEERFVAIFPGKPYKHSVFFRNRGFWNGLSAQACLDARSLPRTKAGLWTEWRKTHLSWK